MCDYMKLTVVCMFRDSEKKLPKFFKQLERLEKQYDMIYFFYENDSKDKTAPLLRKWLKKREGKLLSEKLDAQKWHHEGPGPRMQFMAECREKLLNFMRPIKTEWLFLVDSDVEYKGNIIKQYLAVANKHPEGVAFAPFIEHNMKCHMHRFVGRRCKKKAYYDTLALEDTKKQRSMLFSCNPFWEKEDRKNCDNLVPIKVNMAYGGAVLIKTESTQTASYLPCPGKIDHENFLRSINDRGDIFLIPKVRVYTHIRQPVVPPAAQLQWQHNLLEDPWARMIANL